MINQLTASLWRDEAFSVLLAQKPLMQMLAVTVRDTSPPLYYFLLHYWITVFGNSEISVRSLSLIFFLGTVYFVYLIGKHLFSGRAGKLAAFLTLLNPFLLSFAFEARMYTLLCLTATASMYFFVIKKWKAYVLWSLLALYTHHFASLILFTQASLFLITFLSQDKKAWKTFLPFIIIAGFYLPWLPVFFKQAALIKTGFWIDKPNFISIIKLLTVFLVGSRQWFGQILFLFLVISIFCLRKWTTKITETITLTFWIFSPIFIIFIISSVSQSIFYDRYLIFVIPPLMLLLSSNLRQVKNISLSLTITLILVFGLFANAICFFYKTDNREPFKELAQYIKSRQTKEVGLINLGTTHIFESRYYRLEAPIYAPNGNIPFYIGTALLEKDDIINKLPDKPYLIAIADQKEKEINLPGYWHKVSSRFGGINVHWFEKI